MIVFTMIFGRLFCGVGLSSDNFHEMVFRKIEYWIEGKVRQKVMIMRWTTELILRKGFKHFIFLLISFAISITFLMYIIGERELFLIIQEPIKDHLTGFIALIFFTLVFYAVYAFVREIVCTVVCPYGRLQGVLVDSHT
ncbi:MAG: cytochrome c oxidase accessory protein CcoG, partial [Saprospiraceae bacterium]|nr:cytochrome c oxidase accessory protein CcoG [Saprospiraceae bacterium]